MTFVALTIAGSDPSGGAGIQADLKTFHRFDAYGEAAISLITVQNTTGVQRVECLAPDLVTAQVLAAIEDIPPGAAKTGALGNASIVRAVAGIATGFRFPLIVDPVMISKHGSPLLDSEGVRAVREVLLPRAFLVTPNVPEAVTLAGIAIRSPDDVREAARRIAGQGAGAVLIKGGHLDGPPVDILFTGDHFEEFPGARISTTHTHGTGCTYSAAITALVARGVGLTDAIGQAKAFIHRAIGTNPGLGHGAGPVNHWA